MRRLAAAWLTIVSFGLPLAAPPARAGEAEAPETNPWRRAGVEAIERARALEPANARRAKNVILFIGDGMGMTTITAARIFDGQRRGATGEENQLAFETLPAPRALEDVQRRTRRCAESAATMTALLSGVKTNEEVIGLDERAAPNQYQSAESSRAETLLETAERRGLATGIVTTTRVTHATPAACYAHVPQRDWEDDSTLPPEAREAGFPDIARQLVELPHGDGVDVVLGGGRSQFRPKGVRDPEHPDTEGARLDGRDLVIDWRDAPSAGGTTSRSGSELVALTPDDDPVLGLFERVAHALRDRSCRGRRGRAVARGDDGEGDRDPARAIPTASS